MKNQKISVVCYVILFAIAMGFLESVVVIYLRTIYYPEGFAFPLKLIGQKIALTEILREAATLVMLIFISMIATKKWVERFAFFLLAFAVWDVFYYIFLKLLLNWPLSWFTWDILFLIPFLWAGPVAAPVINSITMIMLAILIFWSTDKPVMADFYVSEWLLLLFGSLLTIFTYVLPYLSFMLQRFSISDVFSFNNSELQIYALKFVPYRFNWWIFGLGELMFVAVIVLFSKRMLTKKHPES